MFAGLAMIASSCTAIEGTSSAPTTAAVDVQAAAAQSPVGIDPDAALPLGPESDADVDPVTGLLTVDVAGQTTTVQNDDSSAAAGTVISDPSVVDQAGSDETGIERPTPEPATVPDGVSIVAQARSGQVVVRQAPDLNAPEMTTLANPTTVGAPLVLLVRQIEGEWAETYLPIRPNGSTGWVPLADVDLSQHPFRVEVRLAEHTLTVYRSNEVILREPVGVGTGDTPTPGGVFYTTELLRPPDPNGAYGHYAFGLSGFSDVIRDFAGGDGVVGIHGTNDPSKLGTDVSHGCIRVSNDAIGQMAATLPLGTPVAILP